MEGEAEMSEEHISALSKKLRVSYYNDIQIRSSVTYEVEETYKNTNLLDAALYSHNSCTAPSRCENEKCDTTRSECATESKYDSFINAYYCDICQVVTESFEVYENHLRGDKHAKMVQNKVMQSSVNSILPSQSFQVPFPSRMEKQEGDSIQGMVNSKMPLALDKIEIPELGDTFLYSELRAAASFRLATPKPQLKNGNNQLQSLKSFDPGTRNACEKVNQVAEKEIDEFLKNVIQKHGRRQISPEIKDSDEKRTYTCSRKTKTDTKQKHICRHKKRKLSGIKSAVILVDNSKSEAHSSVSNSHRNNENASKFITRKYDHSRNYSAESVVCTKNRKISFQTSEVMVSSDESTTEEKTETFTDAKLRKDHCAINTCHKHKSVYSKIINKRKTVESESRVHCRSNSNYPHPSLGVFRKKTEDVSVIQKVTEHLKYPCIGLDKIIEIQGVDKTHYFCELCNLQCSFRSILAHLETFTHRMQCLKEFVPLIYESYSKLSKYEVEYNVNKVLEVLVDMFECGKVTVEKEYLNDGDPRAEKEYLNDSNSRVEKQYPNDGDPCSSMRKEQQSESEQCHSGNQIQYSFSDSGTTVEQINKAEAEFYNSIQNLDEGSHTHQNSLSTNYSPEKEVTSESDFSRNIHNLKGDQQIMSYGKRSSFDLHTNKMPHASDFLRDIHDLHEDHQILSYGKKPFWDYDTNEMSHTSDFSRGIHDLYDDRQIMSYGRRPYFDYDTNQMHTSHFSRDFHDLREHLQIMSYGKKPYFDYDTNEMHAFDFSRDFHDLQEDRQIMSHGKRQFFDYDRYEMLHSPKYYCDVCNSFAESINSWELHLTGGRHIINVKKARGEFPFRRRPVLVPNARATLMRELDQIEEPVVGLDMMTETQDSDAPGPMYRCNLCAHNTTALDIIDHILSQKHRLKFLEKINHPKLQTLKGKSKYDYSSSKMIRNICAEVEAKEGRGYLSVYIRSAEFEPSQPSCSKRSRRLRNKVHFSYI